MEKEEEEEEPSQETVETYLYKTVKLSENSYLNYQLSWMFDNLFHFFSQLTG